MNREQFDHAIRAAAGVLGVHELLVIGSQALHGSTPEQLPAEALHSVEVDVVPLDDDDESKADLVDGSIGEASMFHETFGYYAQGVSQRTGVFPAGWRDRLVRYVEPATGVVAWCVEPHDLWLAKAVAGRPKDAAFCDALLRSRLVDAELLRARIDLLKLRSGHDVDRVRTWIDRSQPS